jgi:hypothetical protein
MNEQRQKEIADLKQKANDKYREMNANIEDFKRISKEYVEILKEIDNKFIEPNF